MMTLWNFFKEKLKQTTFSRQVALPGIFALLLLSAFGGFFPHRAQAVLSKVQGWIYQYMSWWYVLLVSGILIFLIVVAVSKMGKIRLGADNSQPQYSFFSWMAMLFAAGMGIGLMYFGVGEPMAHFAHPAMSTDQPAKEALLETFFHWGFHAWALYAFVGLVLAYFAYRYKLPLSLRSGFYPLLKSKINGPLGHLVDIFALCATFFGISTSLGFGVAQLNAGLVYLGVLPEVSFHYQVGIVVLVMIISLISALSGVGRGVKRLSEINMWAAVLLVSFVLFLGPTTHLLSSFCEGLGYYASSLINLTFNTYAYEQEGYGWFTSWTVMYWAWWISWTPFVGLFIARISRGRTVREFIFAVLLIPSIFIFLWMTVFGEGAIWMDKHVVHGALSAMAGNPDLLLFKFFELFPLGKLLSAIALMMISIFFATSCDSGILVMNGIASSNKPKAPKWQLVFWGILLAVLSLTLLRSGGLAALQTMTLVTALPFGAVLALLCYCLWNALSLDVLYHSSRTPYGSRNWNGEDWQKKMDEILNILQKSDVKRFFKERVFPAFEDLRAAFAARGIAAEIVKIDSGNLKAELVIGHDKIRNFKYGVAIEEKEISDYLVEENNTPDVDSNKAYLPITYYNDGRTGNDIQYLSKEEIIADVLREYERFLGLIADEKNELLILGRKKL